MDEHEIAVAKLAQERARIAAEEAERALKAAYAEEQQAAAKIQKIVRGRRSRVAVGPKLEQAKEERRRRRRVRRQHQAAMRIQAASRSRLTRKNVSCCCCCCCCCS